MSLETVARQTLYRQTRVRGGDLHTLANRALLSRIWRFSARYHRRLGGFVALSVVTAVLAVATPVLARRGRYPDLYETRFREEDDAAGLFVTGVGYTRTND